MAISTVPAPANRPATTISLRLFAFLITVASITAIASARPSTNSDQAQPQQHQHLSDQQTDRYVSASLVSGSTGFAFGVGPAVGLGIHARSMFSLPEPPVARPQLQPELARALAGVSYQAPTRPTVYFTFDDGPDHLGVTDRILDTLDRYDAKATFFVVARSAEVYTDQIARIVDEGHSLANHTYSHPRLTSLSEDGVRRELTKANEVLEGLSGHSIHCYRPPEGKVNERIHAVAADLGIGNEFWTADWGGHWGLWDVDTWDWRRGRERTINAMAEIEPDDVVLMHSLNPFSADIFNEWMEANHTQFNLKVLPGCMEPLVVTPHNGAQNGPRAG